MSGKGRPTSGLGIEGGIVEAHFGGAGRSGTRDPGEGSSRARPRSQRMTSKPRALGRGSAGTTQSCRGPLAALPSDRAAGDDGAKNVTCPAAGPLGRDAIIVRGRMSRSSPAAESVEPEEGAKTRQVIPEAGFAGHPSHGLREYRSTNCCRGTPRGAGHHTLPSGVGAADVHHGSPLPASRLYSSLRANAAPDQPVDVCGQISVRHMLYDRIAAHEFLAPPARRPETRTHSSKFGERATPRFRNPPGPQPFRAGTRPEKNHLTPATILS